MSSSGSTPLHEAILFGTKSVVRGLLRAGASVGELTSVVSSEW